MEFQNDKENEEELESSLYPLHTFNLLFLQPMEGFPSFLEGKTNFEGFS